VNVTTIHRSALVPYSASEMFHLVDDVDSYHQFLPWCAASKVLSRDADQVRATIQVAKGAVNKSFTTVNHLQKDKMIEMRLVEGPFHHLEGFWRFEALEERGCKVSLDMDFEFSGRMMQMLVGPVFSQIAGSLVDAFVKRAEEVYGNKRND
jgi:ribosome-associated toxin RatA of RatAB toxin-antitoxin module